MESARHLCAIALIKVARILVQKRWENSACNHDSRNLICIAGTKPRAETLHTAPVIGCAAHLFASRKQSYPGGGPWVDDGFESETEFQPCSQRRRIGNVDGEEIGNQTKNALGLRHLDLLDGDLLSRLRAHCNAGLHFINPEVADRKGLVLAGIEAEHRSPVCKTFGADGDLIRNFWFQIADFKKPPIICRGRAPITG